MRRKSAEMSAYFRSAVVFAAGVLIGRMSRKVNHVLPNATLKQSVQNTADALKVAEERRNAAESDR